MINAEINNITYVDDELYNRVRAFGPGDGINRPSITVEDSTSISKYGVRETTQDFIDMADYADLQAKATVFLEAHKEIVNEIDITFYFDADRGPGGDIYRGTALTHDGIELNYYRFGDDRQIRRGDTLRIVSQELGLNITGVVEELDWEPGSINITLGKKRYNLVDIINGPSLEEERGRTALELSVPIGFRAELANPGCDVFLNPYYNSRAVGSEIYVGTSPGFEANRDSLASRGAGTRFNFPDLTPGQTYYFKARSYDSAGSFSDLTDEVRAIAGGILGGNIDPGTIDLEQFVPDARPIKLVSILPTVSPTNTDYSIGMLVNFNGGLYRLDSKTSTPAADWVKAIDEASIVGGSITSDSIDAGSVRTAVLISDVISTNMLQANAITADKISANAVEASKIKSGNVVIDGDGNDAATRVRVTDGTNDKAVMGNITGKPGVPSGTQYGFWGALGTGVYIQGAPRLVYSGELFDSGASGTPPYTLSNIVSLGNNITIPSGKKYIITANIVDFFVGTRSVSGDIARDNHFLARFVSGFYEPGLGIEYRRELTGTISTLEVGFVAIINRAVTNPASTPTGAQDMTVYYEVYEVDA